MNLKTICTAIVLALVISSCSNDEPRYSCNAEIEEWVQTHMNEIHSMTRSDWIETDVEYRLPVYRAFTPDQRINFWREKFLELKVLPWSNGELSLIEEVESFFESHLHLFGTMPLSNEQFDEVELFLYKWGEKAKKVYSWSDDMIVSIIASGDEIVDTKGTRYKSSTIEPVVPPKLSCNCHKKSIITCSQHEKCEKSECNASSRGCGGFLLWECDGRCEEPK